MPILVARAKGRGVENESVFVGEQLQDCVEGRGRDCESKSFFLLSLKRDATSHRGVQ